MSLDDSQHGASQCNDASWHGGNSIFGAPFLKWPPPLPSHPAIPPPAPSTLPPHLHTSNPSAPTPTHNPRTLLYPLLFGTPRKEVSFTDQVAEVGRRTKGPSQTKGNLKVAAPKGTPQVSPTLTPTLTLTPTPAPTLSLTQPQP